MPEIAATKYGVARWRPQCDGHFQSFDRHVAQQSLELRVVNVDTNFFQLFGYSGAAIEVKNWARLSGMRQHHHVYTLPTAERTGLGS